MSCCNLYKTQNKNFCADCGISLRPTHFDELPNDLIQQLYKKCETNNDTVTIGIFNNQEDEYIYIPGNYKKGMPFFNFQFSVNSKHLEFELDIDLVFIDGKLYFYDMDDYYLQCGGRNDSQYKTKLFEISKGIRFIGGGHHAKNSRSDEEIDVQVHELQCSLGFNLKFDMKSLREEIAWYNSKNSKYFIKIVDVQIHLFKKDKQGNVVPIALE